MKGVQLALISRLPRRVADGPKIADRITSKKRLREVPDFHGKNEVLEEGMGDGWRLTKLRTSHRLLHQLGEEGVRVIVKAFDFRACQNQKRVGRASEIEFRSSAIVDAMKVADRKRGLGTFALIQNALRAEENIGHAPLGRPGFASGSSSSCDSAKVPRPTKPQITNNNPKNPFIPSLYQL